MRYCWGLGLGLAMALGLGPGAQANLTIDPETITLVGERPSPLVDGIGIPGNRTQPASARLILSYGEGPVTLNTLVSDLRRTDGVASIPASSITVTPAETLQLSPGKPVMVTVTVDFAAVRASGEFMGGLYFYRGQNRQVIPISARVKTAPLLPWIVMITGVLLGTGLSLYRSQGRSRDEIVVQVGHLRNQMRADQALHKDFSLSIQSELEDVFRALEDRDWTTAKAEVLEARNRWTLWRKYREDWLAQLAYRDQLLGQFEQMPEPTQSSPYMQMVKNSLDSIGRKIRASQYKDPQELSTSLAEVRQQVAQYKAGEALVDSLKERRRDLPQEQGEIWRHNLDQMEKQLRNLTPDLTSYEDWQTNLKAMETRLEEDIVQALPESPPHAQAGTTVLSRGGAIPVPELQTLPSVPDISLLNPADPVYQARANLQWFNHISRTVAIIFLAWLGMTELYANKPTFGADPMRDYFALLAWGFGAELTRESMVKASQDLGITLGR